MHTMKRCSWVLASILTLAGSLDSVLAAPLQESQKVGETPIFTVPITVEEPASVARTSERVTFGIPLPRHPPVLFVERLGILEADSRTIVPSQIRVQSRWHGSVSNNRKPIRWILVTFPATLLPGETTIYYLAATRGKFPRPRRENELEVTENKNSFEISTGPLRCEISRDRFDLFRQVWIDQNENGKLESPLLPDDSHASGIVIERKGGSLYTSSDDSAPSISLMEAGPERAVLSVSGALRSNTQNRITRDQLAELRYRAWYFFTRGSSSVRVLLTIHNPDRRTSKNIEKGGDELAHEFEDLTLRLALKPGDPRKILFSGEKPYTSSVETGHQLLLYQDSSGSHTFAPPTKASPFWATSFQGYQVRKLLEKLPEGVVVRNDKIPKERQGQILSRGKKSAGWAQVLLPKGRITVGVRDFTENFPKAIRVSGDIGLDLSLFPGEWSVPHRIPGGVQKTHDMVFHFDSEDALSTDAPESAIRFLRPLLPTLYSEDYLRSEALGLFSLEDPERFAFSEESTRAMIQYSPPRGQGNPKVQGSIYREREDKDLYGWLNYGDHYRGGSKNSRYWGNNEFDFSWVMLLSYLRGTRHDRRFFENGRIMALHLQDIDIYHTMRDLPSANGGVRKHDASGIIDHSRPPNLSHFWIAGLSLYAQLTGDPPAHKALSEIADWIAALESSPKRSPGLVQHCAEIRSRGWVVLACLDLYELTGEAPHLERAKRILHTMVIEPLGAKSYLLSGSDFRKAYQGDVVPWQMAYVTEALGRYLHIQRDRGERDLIAQKAFFQLLGFYEAHGFDQEKNIMCYVWDSITEKPSAFNANLSQTAANGLAYGYLLTGNQKHLDWATTYFEAGNQRSTYPAYYTTTLGTPAKNRCLQLRFGQVAMFAQQLAAGKFGHPEILEFEVSEFRGGSGLLRVTASHPVSVRIVYGPTGGPTGGPTNGPTEEKLQTARSAPGFSTQTEVWVRDLPPEEVQAVAILIDPAGQRVRSKVLKFTRPPR